MSLPHKDDMSKLEKALELARSAVASDAVDDVHAARQSYADACRLLEQAIDDAFNANERKKLIAIHESYAERVRLLDELVRDETDCPRGGYDVNPQSALESQVAELDLVDVTEGSNRRPVVCSGATDTAPNSMSQQYAQHGVSSTPSGSNDSVVDRDGPPPQEAVEHDGYIERLRQLHLAISLDSEDDRPHLLGSIRIPPATWSASTCKIKGEQNKIAACDALVDAIGLVLTAPARNEPAVAHACRELQGAVETCEQSWSKRLGAPEHEIRRSRSASLSGTTARKRLLKLVGVGGQAQASHGTTTTLSHLQYRQAFSTLLQQLILLGTCHSRLKIEPAQN